MCANLPAVFWRKWWICVDGSDPLVLDLILQWRPGQTRDKTSELYHRVGLTGLPVENPYIAWKQDGTTSTWRHGKTKLKIPKVLILFSVSMPCLTWVHVANSKSNWRKVLRQVHVVHVNQKGLYRLSDLGYNLAWQLGAYFSTKAFQKKNIKRLKYVI